ncbi:hypothetical protein BH09ACT1_BH09ACT1_02470 [soil metagenome]
MRREMEVKLPRVDLQSILHAGNEMTMTEFTADTPGKSTPESYERDMRQLALVDRIIGLEAQVAHLRSVNTSQALKDQLKEVKGSTTWKVGRLVLSPLLAVQGLRKRSTDTDR